MRLRLLSASVIACLVAGCADSDDCGDASAPANFGDRVLGALRFHSLAPTRRCGKMSPPPKEAPAGLQLLGTGDGTGVLAPGSTVPFTAAWDPSSAGTVQLSFGGSSLLQVPLSRAESNRGFATFPADLDPEVCAQIDNVCHALLCCMQIVTPTGTYSASIALRMVLDCTGGAGCPSPYNRPPGSCEGEAPAVVDSPADLGPPATDDCAACRSPHPVCAPSGRCVACLTDAHCLAGKICRMDGPFANTCIEGCRVDGDCRRGGVESLSCCNGACVNLSGDPVNCGACGASCGAPQGYASCSFGACLLSSCFAGWADCNNLAADGCEINLRSDAQHCGACGSICQAAHALAGCGPRCFIAACDPGFEDCNHEFKDGCEADLASDVRSCSACGSVCAPPYANPACVMGRCGIASCLFGFLDCDGMVNNGCEVSRQIDAWNCGSCGNRCPQGQVCSSGVCQ